MHVFRRFPGTHVPPAAAIDRRNPGAARLRGVRRRPQPRHRALPLARDAAAALPRGRGGGRQNRDRPGDLAGARPRADPPAVLRGPRHLAGRLRGELLAADDRDQARRGGGREGQRPARRAELLRAAPGHAAAPPREVVEFVQRLRKADLFKLPGVAETIDWVNCLVALDRVALDPETVNNTLGVLLKYRDDLEKLAGEEATRLVSEAKAAAAA